jgi:hypothetical protein
MTTIIGTVMVTVATMFLLRALIINETNSFRDKVVLVLGTIYSALIIGGIWLLMV